MKKILVIEDNDNIRENTSEILMLAGYQVFAVNCGEQGLVTAAQIHPDLIICDIVMYGLNGFEVFSSLKGNVQLRDIPFIFMTAKTDKSELRTGMELGADDYITKPFDAETLLAAVSKIITPNSETVKASQHTDPAKQEIHGAKTQ